MNNMGILLQAMKNPQAFMQQAMNNNTMMQNPMFKNAVEMYQKGDLNGIEKLADNLCREKGINRTDLEKQLKTRLGI